MSCNHNKAEVKRHIAGEHGENELKAFKIKDVKAWKERFEEKNPKGVESNVCPFCAGTFKCLEQHIKYKHESEKPWKCDKCDFAHATKMGLQGHARAVHPQEKNFCCHLCGFKTYANSVLKVHIESKHEKKKRFFCSHCEDSFYYKVKYQEHLSRLHTGEKIFNCKECTDVAFTSYEHLRTHTQKVHKGVRFICDMCRKEFSTSAVKSKHMRQVHGVKMSEMKKLDPKE